MLFIHYEANNSDQRPLSGCIDVKWDNTSSTPGHVKPISNNAVSVCWDIADLSLSIIIIIFIHIRRCCHAHTCGL